MIPRLLVPKRAWFTDPGETTPVYILRGWGGGTRLWIGCLSELGLIPDVRVLNVAGCTDIWTGNTEDEEIAGHLSRSDTEKTDCPIGR